MTDYFLKLENFTEDECLAEIEKISKKMIRAPRGSMMYQGLLDLYTQATASYNERMYARQLANRRNPAIIELGEIKAQEYTPDYSQSELVNAVIQAYLGDPNDNKSK